MPERDEKVIISDIHQQIEFILKITTGITKEDFLSNQLIAYAADRAFEIIGEATRQLPQSFQQLHAEIEWNKMISFRNLLIHEYFRVERNIQWNIIKNILPGLKVKLEKFLST